MVNLFGWLVEAWTFTLLWSVGLTVGIAAVTAGARVLPGRSAHLPVVMLLGAEYLAASMLPQQAGVFGTPAVWWLVAGTAWAWWHARLMVPAACGHSDEYGERMLLGVS